VGAVQDARAGVVRVSVSKDIWEKIRDEEQHKRINAELKQAMYKQVAHDPIDHPRHYTSGGVETIEAIEAWQLGFHLGNAVKYISRAGKKDPDKTLEDLKKARWYLDREIARLVPSSSAVEPSTVNRDVGGSSPPSAAKRASWPCRRCKDDAVTPFGTRGYACTNCGISYQPPEGTTW
jgi:hypothetical protein